ncbi:MAG: OsmC family peroxiredoxin [Promethearchaeota archaeon]|nr:MAG: OsmC family peroxiredoxin [Candidatus Lokiarchaeota archaeon]
MSKQLITDESRTSYINRFKKMQELGFTEKGDELFRSRLVAEAEQVDNLHVKSKIGEFEIENDAPEALGGSNAAPAPMPMLLATIANCLEITALLYFSFLKVNVDSIKVRVEATFDKRCVLPNKEAPLPGFYDINYVWYIESKEKLRRIENVLEKVEKFCPVKGTLTRNHDFKQKIVLV